MDFGRKAGDSTPNLGKRPVARTPGRKPTQREQRLVARGAFQAEEHAGYATAIQMYQRPPVCDISLEEFEERAVERLKVLRAIEKHNLGGVTKFSTEWVEKIKTELEKQNLSEYLELANLIGGSESKPKHYENRRIDHVSHFILRLAYCRTEELRRWFVSHETDLFRLRWSLLHKDNPQLLKDFMVQSNLHYVPITAEEKAELGEDLQSATRGGISGHKVADDEFYRVPWIEALDLVRSRRVLVRAGQAYIPRDELLSLVVGVFRAKLSHNLVLTCRALPVLEEDSRLVSLVQNLDKRYTGDDYSAAKSGERILPPMVASLSEKHFPLCMRTMQHTLQTTHSLKYKARLQYGLFLKGIGMSLEDAMKFWRGEFTQRTDIDVDKFEKEYAYGIRYNYGKEGKKKNWQPWDCMKIIMENVGPGENHGCPFRHHEGRTLRQQLESYQLRPADLEAILQKVEEGHYQVACGLHFSVVHLRDLTTGVTNHPNQWYLESRNMLQSNSTTTTTSQGKQLPSTQVKLYANSQSQNSQSSQVAAENSYLNDMDDSELISAMETGAL